LWKQTERRIARQFGGIVISRLGVKGVDVETDWLCIEVKERNQLPVWINEALDRARKAGGEKKLGIVILHQKGYREDVVMLAVSDFRQWFGELRRKVVIS